MAKYAMSLPAWGAWIEILNKDSISISSIFVAPRMGSVD